MPHQPDQTVVDRNAARAKALRDLETPICELASMAGIMAHLLNAMINGEFDKENRIVRLRIDKDELDTAVFAYCNVASRAVSLKKAFYAADKEEDHR